MYEAFKSACAIKWTLKGYAFDCMHTLAYTYKNEVYFGLQGIAMGMA